MRILFVYPNMYAVGGIETLLVRYARRLSAMGHDIHLLARSPAPPADVTMSLVDEFARHGSVHIADDRYSASLGSLRRVGLPACDAVVGCNVHSSLLAAVVQAELMPNARLVLGVFASREYCFGGPWWQRRWDQRLGARLIKAVPAANVIFATDSMARITESCSGRDFANAEVIPLAIESDVAPRDRRPGDGPLRVVSIARLDHFYAHHWHMVGVVRELRERGLEIEYHVYGAGHDQDDLSREIRAQGVGNAVFLHGRLPYAEFGRPLDGAFAYIGLGTALIEAAARGIPALVGIAHHPQPLTYGYLGETVGNDLGGRVPGHPEFQIADRLRWLAALDDAGYAEVARAGRERAREFEIAVLAPRFLDALDRALPFRFPLPPLARAIGRLDQLLYRVMLRAGLAEPPAQRYVRADAQSG